MPNKTFFVILCAGVLGCHNVNYDDEAVINGHIESNKNGEIYLIDIAKNDVIKDSTKIVDGQFNFTYKTASLPFEAMLCMWDGFKGTKYLRPIGFVNPYKKNNIESIFYLDKGITSIKTTENNPSFYEINGSRQNEPYYKHLELGDLNKNQSAAERKNLIANDLSLITKYPYSFYLLNTLYVSREQYTNDELKLLMEGFTNDAKALLPYKKLRNWIAYKQKGIAYLPDIVLENEKGSKEHIFDTTAKINMLVFWASWCSPCRKEIPNLKNVYLKYHTKGLSITSISIDNNEKSWQNALAIEKMPWKQLITNDSAKNAFDIEFGISSIPLVVLIDRKKEIIQRYTDFSPNEEYSKSLSILDKK